MHWKRKAVLKELCKKKKESKKKEKRNDVGPVSSEAVAVVVVRLFLLQGDAGFGRVVTTRGDPEYPGTSPVATS